jgi:signal peptidase I
MHRLPTPIKKIISITSQLLFVAMIILGAGIIFHNLYYAPIIIVGSSMEPTLRHNEFGIMDTQQRAIDNLKRFDIIIVKVPLTQQSEQFKLIIKRLIALPSETLRLSPEGALTINDESISQDFIPQEDYLERTCDNASNFGCQTDYTLNAEQIFVMGDNRGSSDDSRKNGAYAVSQIFGKLIAIEGFCSQQSSSGDAMVDLSGTCPNRTYIWPRLYV